MNKVYINTSFTGHYPVGSAAVVVAQDDEDAAYILELELRQRGLEQKVNRGDMIQIPTHGYYVSILCDGNY